MLVCILKLEGLLQGYVKWKNTMTCNVNFMTQNVGPWTCYKQFIWDIDILCPLRYIFKLVCILKLEGLLQGYVKWKNNNVNFMTQNVGSETLLRLTEKFLCPLRYIFEASVHFKVGRSSSRLC